MKIVWDEPKRAVNIDKHKLDFADVIYVDCKHALIDVIHSNRMKAIGYFADDTTVIVFSKLGIEAISIISFRQANKKEGFLMTIKKTFETGCGYTKEDWDAVDSSPLTDEELIRLKPAKDVLSSSFFKYVTEERRKRGRSPVESPKQAVTLRLDPNVIVSTTFSFLRKGRGVVFLKLSSFHDNFC